VLKSHWYPFVSAAVATVLMLIDTAIGWTSPAPPARRSILGARRDMASADDSC
jgi:hypothetical protein